MEVFMDDFVIYKYNFDNYLSNLEKVLEICVKVNLMLNQENFHFIARKVTTLEHFVSNRGIQVDKAKLQVIEKLPYPASVKEVRSFLVHEDFMIGSPGTSQKYINL